LLFDDGVTRGRFHPYGEKLPFFFYNAEIYIYNTRGVAELSSVHTSYSRRKVFVFSSIDCPSQWTRKTKLEEKRSYPVAAVNDDKNNNNRGD